LAVLAYLGPSELTGDRGPGAREPAAQCGGPPRELVFPLSSSRGPTPEASVEPVVSRFTVRSYELDSFGHLNHAVFLNYFEQARFDALEACGWPIQKVLDRGWAVYVVRIEVDYLAEAMWHDELVIETRVDEVRGSSMTLVQEARKPDGTATASARVVGVWVGANRRPMRMPKELREGLLGLGD